MASVLYAIQHTPELGRHLVSSQPIAQGRVVLVQEPYAAVLYEESQPQRCDYCFCAGQSLLRCSRSRLARYCCREHQAAAWRLGYKEECEALVKAGRAPPPTIRLAARALWRYVREQQSGLADPACSWEAWQSLLDHWQSLEDDKKVQYAQMAVLARNFAASGLSSPDAAESLPSIEAVAHLLARGACNNHTICDAELRPVGLGMFPLGALLNHGCRPNCMQSFGPRGRIEFRALVDIAPGEPLTISYIELAATRQERREELAATYFFDIAGPMPPAHGVAATAAETAAAGAAGAEAATSQAAAGVGPGAPLVPDAVATGAAPGPPGPAPLPPGYAQHLRPAPLAEVDIPLGQQEQELQALFSPAAQGASLQAQAAASVARNLAAAVDPAATAEPAGRLRVYSGVGPGQQRPPWPVDERDELLTQLVVVLPAAGAAGGREEVPLPGGLQARLVRQPQPPQEFSGGEGEEDGVEDEGYEGGAVGDSAAEAAVASLAQVAEVDCWGDWAVRSVVSATQRLEGGTASPEAASSSGEGGGRGREAALGALARHMATAVHMQGAAEKLGRQGRVGEAAQLLQRALEIVEPGCGDAALPGREGAPGLGRCHLLRMRLNAALLKVTTDDGNWALALGAARALTPAYELVYPPVWPNLGLHYAMLAKLELLEDCPERAQACARRAMSILCITHSQTGGLRSGGMGVLQNVELSLSEAGASASPGEMVVG